MRMTLTAAPITSAGRFSPFGPLGIMLQPACLAVSISKTGEKEMPITVSYDLSDADTNERNYIRSMFERFGWKRLGGSVFRYEGDGYEEDWLNEVIPALMIFRSYILAKDIDLRFFTLDTNSVTHIDFSDPDT